MSWRKFKADLIFTGNEILPPDHVLVTDENGTVGEIVPGNDAGDGIETFEGVLTPGFINTHCHLELSHMKGVIAPGTGLVEFLTRVIRERNFAAADVLMAMEQAENEMYNKGIVAVGDICNTTDSIGIKKASRIQWKNFIEVLGFTNDNARARLDYSGKVLTAFHEAQKTANPGSNPDVEKSFIMQTASLTPHAPYSVSQRLFGMINDNTTGETVSIHNQECAAENELYRSNSGEMFRLYKNLNIDPSFFKASGKSSLRTYLPWLTNQKATILVHNTYADEDDILFANSLNGYAHALYYCICINANRYIESANPPLELLRKNGCTITLGTDSYASNTQLDLLEEMKTIQQEFPAIPLAELLQWATLNGAKALNMENRLGSFYRGSQPGVLLLTDVVQQKLSAGSRVKRLL